MVWGLAISNSTSELNQSSVRRDATIVNHPLRRAWVPALLWLAVIAWESTPYGSSNNTAALLFAVLHVLVPHLTPAQLDLTNEVARKAGHFTGYGLLSLFMLRGWWATIAVPRGTKPLPSWRAMLQAWSARAAALALASTALVASLDEWHQAFIPGRTSTWRDVVLDTMAGAFVQLMVIAIGGARSKRLAISN